MTIVVTGGTGFVGHAVCEQLVQQFPGLTLRVPTRGHGAGQAIRPLPGVQLLQADIHQPAQAAALMQGADALVQLVAILHGSDAAFDRVHVQLQRTLAAAAVKAGVQRVVQVSALGVSAQAPSAYLRSKAAGEAVWLDSGVDVRLLRPSVIFGRDDRFTNLFASLLKLAPLMPLAGAKAQFQPVWVGDVAQAVARLLVQGPVDDPVTEAAGPEQLSLAQIIGQVGEMTGHRRPVINLPMALGRLQATLMGLMPGEPMMSRDNLLSMQVPNIATGRHAGLASLGIQPMALRGLAEHFAPKPAYRR